jgi:hypothetical protein
MEHKTLKKDPFRLLPPKRGQKPPSPDRGRNFECADNKTPSPERGRWTDPCKRDGTEGVKSQKLYGRRNLAVLIIAYYLKPSFCCFKKFK